MNLGRLYVVTDRRVAGARAGGGGGSGGGGSGGGEAEARALIEVVSAALAAVPPGAALVQLREKDLPARELMALARRLLRVTRQRRCPLLINDRIDVALAAGADGVHLPEGGLPIAAVRRLRGRGRLVIGVSVHGADAAGAAAQDGADLVVCGPVWDTPSKRAVGLEPMGEDELAAGARAAGRAEPAPSVYAIGGVTDPERAAAAVRAGAHGIAVIRAIMAAADPGKAAAALWSATAEAAAQAGGGGRS